MYLRSHQSDWIIFSFDDKLHHNIALALGWGSPTCSIFLHPVNKEIQNSNICATLGASSCLVLFSLSVVLLKLCFWMRYHLLAPTPVSG